jgi:hypothetical protein
MKKILVHASALLCAAITAGPAIVWADSAAQPLFPKDGPVREGWVTRHWGNVAEAPKNKDAYWEVRDGVLYGTGRYDDGKDESWVGTWLLSEREYSNFILELDFKFKNGGARGNGGIALRAPLTGDPAYEGIELQVTDERYERSFFPDAGKDQLTGALYYVSPAKELKYKQGEWNHYRIEVRGPKIKVWLNDFQVQDADLSTFTQPAKKHGKGTEVLPAKPGAERPLRGHIGFQDLSDSGEVLMFRNVKIQSLE